MSRQFLYAVLFRNGLVKFGRSTNVRNRLRALKNSTSFEIQSAWSVECDWFSVSKIERQLLEWADSVACRHKNTNEFFHGMALGCAVNKLKQVGHRQSLIKVKTTWGDAPPRHLYNIPSQRRKAIA